MDDIPSWFRLPPLVAAVLLLAAASASAAPPLWRGMRHLDEWAENVRTNQSLHTWDQFRRERYEPFLRREIVQPYLDFSSDRGTVRFAAGSNLLERFVADIPRFRSLDYGSQAPALAAAMRDTAVEGEALVRSGSDWPLFRIMALFRGLGQDDSPDPRAILDIVAGIPDAAAYAFVRTLGAGLLWHTDPPEAYGVCAESVIHWLNSRAFEPEEARPLLLALELTATFAGSSWNTANSIAVPEILDHCPRLDPWIRELVSGMLKWRLAPGQATEADRRANVEAMAHFFKAWHLRPEYPEAPFQILYRTVGNPDRILESGLPLPNPDVWFNRVQEAEVDYLVAYRQYAFPLSPVWGGRMERERALAEALRKADRPEFLFPILHGHFLILSICGTDIPTWELFRDDAVYVPFQKALSQVADSPSPLWKGPLVASYLLALAEISRGNTDAASLWARRLAPDQFGIGTAYANSDTGFTTYWGSPAFKLNHIKVQTVVAALGGPNGERLAPLVKLCLEGRAYDFLSQLDAECEKGLAISPAEADFIGRAEVETLVRTTLAQGRTVNPRIDPLFTGWEHASGWVFDDADGMAGFAHTNKVNIHGYLSWNGRLPRDIRISAHLQFPVTNACLVLYFDNPSSFDTEGPAVAFLRAEDGVYAQAGNSMILDDWNAEAGRRLGRLNPRRGPADPSRRKPTKGPLPDAPGIGAPVPAGGSRDAIDFEVESRAGGVTVRIDGETVITNAPLSSLYSTSRSTSPLRIRGNGVKLSGVAIQTAEGRNP